MVSESVKAPVLGQRHAQTALLFTGIVVNLYARYNASISVVAMTKAETTNPDFDEYDWDEQEKAYILSSFFWGYVITQLPGGQMARRFGVKRILFVTTIGSALFALLTPFCLPWGGWKVYCAIRLVQGLFQGPIIPCLHAHLAVWSPTNEKNRLGALASSGVECSCILSMVITGFIAVSKMGWPGISYITCGMGVVWCVFWQIFAADSPKQSKFITEAELAYILNSQNPMKKNNKSSRLIPVPWKAILMSVPFWMLILVRSAQCWGYSTLLTQIPFYMNGVLNMDIEDNAVFSGLPYLVSWLLTYVFLFVSDILLNRQILSLNAMRKSINTVALCTPAAVLIGIGFLDEKNKALAIILMTIGIGLNAGCAIGCTLNTIDLSPNHAGSLMSVVNTISNCMPIITPLVAGFIVQDEHNRSQWQIVFIITAVIYAAGNFVYVLFGSTDRQPWDDEYFLGNDNEQHENYDIKAVENNSNNNNSKL